MYVDSHCHLDRVDLRPYDGDFGRLMALTAEAGVSHMLCVAIDLGRYPAMRSLVDPYPSVAVSVGVHPNEGCDGAPVTEPSVEVLVALAEDARVVAIGETGLDYHYAQGDPEWQRARFRTHIRAARHGGKPLIIHSREAREDTIGILRDEGADAVGGVLHCFTETWEMASQGLDLGFYVSFSGIVTFKNAGALRDMPQRPKGHPRGASAKPRPMRVPVPGSCSGRVAGGDPEEPKVIGAGGRRQLGDGHPPQLGDTARHMGDKAGLVGLAPVGDGREIGRVGLDQEAV
jgi:TatD DNase family protein